MSGHVRHGGLAPWLAVAALAGGCGEAPAGPGGLPWSAADLRVLRSMTPLPEVAPSPTNPYADHPGAAALGHRLFFDAGLSADGTLSCATCHRPERHFADDRPMAVGRRELPRNTPSVVDLSHAPFLTWDGRKDSLWSQALGPLLDEDEMGGTPRSIAEHVRSRYADAYRDVFGQERGPAPDDLEVCVDVARALEAYQRRLRHPSAPFDRFVAALLAGDPRGGLHMSRQAVRGLRIFIGPGACVGCHSGPLLTDFSFHDIGLPPVAGSVDSGRTAGIRLLLADPFRADGPFSADPRDRGYDHLDGGYEHHAGAFKTPSLRQVAATAPYGHDGRFATLPEMLEVYRSAAREARGRHLDPLLARVAPDFDVTAVVAFLEALSGPPPEEPWYRAPSAP